MHTEKDKEVLRILTDESGKYVTQRLRVKSLTNLGVYDYLLNRYSDNTTGTIKEILYRLINDIEEVPTCPMCGKPVPFSNSHGIYPVFCSRSCCANDPAHKTQNSESATQHLLEDYADPEKREAIMNKKIVTLKNNTGYDNNGSPFSIPTVREKSKQTLLARYGVTNAKQIKK